MNNETNLGEFHWLIGMLHTINVGLIVIDRQYAVQMWNDFMASRSGLTPDRAMGKNILELYPEIPEDWFKRKLQSVFLLETRAFTSWEQRPYLFKCKNYLPITGAADHMFQDVTFIPLTATDGKVSHVGIMIYDVTDVAINKHELQNANNTLELLSRTDRLTQLNNRGYWEECLEKEYDRYKRSQQSSSLLIFDIDHFKKVNDTYGHQAGDEVIRQTAKLLRDSIRVTDIAGRYGGEEFTLILPATTADKALILAERLRQRIQALSIKFLNVEIQFTISLGIADLNKDIESYKQWLEYADQALYKSKQSGRNRTSLY